MISDRHLVEAYILHARKYRDTSLIVELLTRRDGRVSAVMRGVRSKRSKTAGYIRPFARILVAWLGKGELKTVTVTDFPFPPGALQGDALLAGLYVNELLVKLLGKYDPSVAIYEAYGALLQDLSGATALAIGLRRFELILLQELGYGITFERGVDGDPVRAGCWYRYVPDEGFHAIGESPPDQYAYRGEDLLQIVEGRFEVPEIDTCAKRVIRSSFAVLLGQRSLRSRELFRKVTDVT
jgi:DNA repair protein RecO (recombination protein O)